MKYRLHVGLLAFVLLPAFSALYGSYGGEWTVLGGTFPEVEDAWPGDEMLFGGEQERSPGQESDFFDRESGDSDGLLAGDDPSLSAPPPGDVGSPQKVPLAGNELLVWGVLCLMGAGVYGRGVKN